jgi:hypothetical protein
MIGNFIEKGASIKGSSDIAARNMIRRGRFSVSS